MNRNDVIMLQNAMRDMGNSFAQRRQRDLMTKMEGDRQRLQEEMAAWRQQESAGAVARYEQERNDRMQDPVYQLSRKEAQAKLDAFGQPAPQDELADLRRQTDILRARQELSSLSNPALPQPRPEPGAKITHKMGDVTATYEAPMVDLRAMEQRLTRDRYASPYAADIADQGRIIAREQSAMAGGDKRTGFLGIGRSRQGVVDGARRQMQQLRAMELQDMLEKGIITQQEADRRAALLMQQ